MHLSTRMDHGIGVLTRVYDEQPRLQRKSALREPEERRGGKAKGHACDTRASPASCLNALTCASRQASRVRQNPKSEPEVLRLRRRCSRLLVRCPTRRTPGSRLRRGRQPRRASLRGPGDDRRERRPLRAGRRSCAPSWAPRRSSGSRVPFRKRSRAGGSTSSEV